jgi:hypothetical protein
MVAMTKVPGRSRSGLIRACAVTLDIVGEQRRLRRAATRMPKPVPWDWAAPRVLPLLAGPRIDQPDTPIVRTIVDPGCAIIFALMVSGASILVDRPVTERWECSVDQLLVAAMTNLRRKVSGIRPVQVREATFSGRIVRILEGEAASSLLLAGEDLRRLFGEHDQILAAPNLSTLLSFPIDCPSDVVGTVVVEFEMRSAWPLMLDPFLLCDGALTYQIEADD